MTKQNLNLNNTYYIAISIVVTSYMSSLQQMELMQQTKSLQQTEEKPADETKQVVNQYCYYNIEFVPKPFGFNNTGAICWFNSLTQIMLGLSSMNKTLLECENELTSNVFAMEYIKILKSTLGRNPSEFPNNTSQMSIALLQAMFNRAKQTSKRINLGMGQECADEAFTTFIDLLGCPLAERLFCNIYDLSIECTACRKKVSSTRDKSYRISMFTNVKIETQDKFCAWIKSHPSECDYYACECGNKMSKFFRAEKLKRLSEILIIVFNKFQRKDIRWFPRELEFNAVKGGKIRYNLVGKIEHSGSMSGGHYWAHSYRGDWNRLNDSSVSVGDCNPTGETFMIAYHMVE